MLVVVAIALCIVLVSMLVASTKKSPRPHRRGIVVPPAAARRTGGAPIRVVAVFLASSAAVGVATEAAPRAVSRPAERDMQAKVGSGSLDQGAASLVKSARREPTSNAVVTRSLAHAPDAAASGSVTVRGGAVALSGGGIVPVYSFTATPLFASAAAQQFSSGTANYLIANTSTGTSSSLTITFVVVGCIGGINGCATPQPTTLAPGQSSIVWVPFGAGMITASPQPLVLKATASAPDATSLSATAIVAITIVPQGPSQQAVVVTPSSSASSTAPGMSGTTAYFVQNTTTGMSPNSPLLIQLAINCPSSQMYCDKPSPYISLPQGAAQLVSVNYTGMQSTASPVPVTLSANIVGAVASDTTPTHRYRFAPSAPLVDDYGGPSLAGPGIVDGSGYHFDAGNGLSLAGALTNGAVYTVAFDFTLTTLDPPLGVNGDGWAKLLDFKDRTSDIGPYLAGPNGGFGDAPGTLYLYDGSFAPNLNAGAVLSRATNRFVMTRSAAGIATIYVNGRQVIQGSDAAADYTFNQANNIIRFFQDDTSSPGATCDEYPTGAVQSILIYDRVLSPSEVLALPASSSGTVNVTVTGGPPPPPEYSIKVTSANRTSSAYPGMQGTATYTVQNTSTASGPLYISLAIGGCTGGNISCVQPPPSVQLAQGALQNVSVAYYGGQPTNIPIALTLTGSTSAPDGQPPHTSSSTVNVSVDAWSPPPPPSVYAGPPAPSPASIPNGGSGVMSFNIGNNAPSSQSVTYSVTCGGLASCSAWPATQLLDANSTGSAWVYFTAGPNQNGTFPVTLTATGPGGSSSATGQVIVTGPQYNLLVTTSPIDITVAQGSTGAVTFSVRNTSTNATLPLSITYSTGGCPNNTPLANCGLQPPGPISVMPGATQNVVVPFTAVAPTTRFPVYLVTATNAPDGTYHSSAVTGYVTVTGAAPTYALSVSPNPSTSSTPVGTSGIAYFTVQNTSSNSSTSLQVTFAVSGCPSSIVSSCPAPASISIAPGAAPTVAVPYYGLAVGSAALTLTASSAGYTSPVSGTVNVTVTAASQTTTVIASSLVGPFPGGTITRNACLTISAGANAAYECGALRVVHALPTTTTFGKPRTPVLLYNSTHAAPGAIIAADVTITGPVPASIEVTVKIPNKGPIQRSFPWDPAWTDGQPRRISVAIDAVAMTLTTGSDAVLVVDTVEFKATSAAGAPLAQVTKTGLLAIVDRRDSPFGSGWWLDGLERFVSVPGNSNVRLWIGGDGSTRVYTYQGTKYWLATPAPSRPDTLESDSSGVWRRHLPNGAYVEFDQFGTHTKTVDVFGRRTVFNYTTLNGRLVPSTITLPVQSGTVPTYVFGYAPDPAQIWRVSQVTAPPVNGSRVVTLSTGTGRVSNITDTTGVTSFRYNATQQLTQRINKLRDTTNFAYDEAGLLRSASLDMRRDSATAPPIAQSFCAAESRSLTTCGGGAIQRPVLTAKAYTLLDGPRTDAPDTTIFHIGQFGTPDTVVTALGYRTRVERANVAFPLLATATIAPNGHRIEARYTSRGLDSLVIDRNPLGDGVDATTSYLWHTKWDKPVRVTSPTGLVTTSAYDAATGNQMWQRPGDNPARQVSFSYYSTGQLASVTAPLVAPESLYYDNTLSNLRASRSGLGFYTLAYRDAVGRETLSITPIDTAAARDTNQLKSAGASTRTFYNVADQADSVVRSGPARPYTLRFASYADQWQAPVTADTVYIWNSYDGEGRLLSVKSEARPLSASSDISVRDTYAYDPAGRMVRRGRNNRFERTVYDLAGNVIAFTPATGAATTSQYDTLGRLRTRTVPARTYAEKHCEGLAPGSIADSASTSLCRVVFPAFPTDATANTYTIAADQSTFSYDSLGNTLTANNSDARISRQYYRNGALKRDSVAYRATTAPGFNYSATLAYSYDREGRRQMLQLPSGDSLTYGYHAELGVLTRITDPRGNRYRYDYDLAGRIDSVIVGTASIDGTREERRYDAEGRSVAHARYGAAALGLIYLDSLTLDAAGRTIRAASSTRANLSPADTTYFTYSGLGSVLARERIDGASRTESEEFRVDALGNVLASRAANSDFGGPGDVRTSTFAFLPGGGGSRGFLTRRETSAAPQREGEIFRQSADADGNLEQSQDQTRQPFAIGHEVTLDTPTRQYYSAAGQLRAVQRYRVIGQDNGAFVFRNNGVFEEYRYDALGRRVLVLARHVMPAGSRCTPAALCEPLCNVNGCNESVTRAVWDGNAMVHEERRRYPDEALTPPLYNIVEYVHGVETDRPLATLDTRLPSLTRAISYTWRGMAEASTTADGQAGDNSLGTGNFDRIAWVDGQGIYSRPTPQPNDNGGTPYLWGGSLLQDQQDRTGQHYRRNRYYDPQSGRFTQEDPIGLAGGMNLYGFAGGDPVNFSDPFGLWPEWVKNFAAGMHAVTSVEGGSCSGFACKVGAWAGLASMLTVGGSAERVAGRVLAEEALVVRGGTNTAERIAAGAESIDGAGMAHGVSVNSAPGMSAAQLARGIPHNKIGITTVGAIKGAGGKVVADATAANPTHCLVSCISPEALSKLLTPVVTKP